MFSAKLPVPTEPYLDLTVLAFPRPAEDGDNAAARKPAITCSKGDTPEKMVYGDPASVCKFAENSDEANPVSVLLDFKTAFTARSLTVKPAPASIDLGARLEVGRWVDMAAGAYFPKAVATVRLPALEMWWIGSSSMFERCNRFQTRVLHACCHPSDPQILLHSRNGNQ